MMSDRVKLSLDEYVHVYDRTSNITRLEVGPQNLLLEGNDELVFQPCPYVKVPPSCYCTIRNPLKLYEHREKVELKLGHLEIRLHQEPFPLFPGEELVDGEGFHRSRSFHSALKKLPVIKANHAIRLRARYDCTDSDGKARIADEEWHEEGPMTYIPVPEVEIVGMVEPEIIQPHRALHLMAKRSFVDKEGVSRYTGEEWLRKSIGAYVPSADEEVCGYVKAVVLNDKLAAHLRAKYRLVDFLGKTRQSGEEWLVTNEDCESFIPDVGIHVVRKVNKTVLDANSYCVIRNPIDASGKIQLGKRILKQGIDSFFLRPHEEIEHGVLPHFLLGENEALKVVANIEFEDDTPKGKVHRLPGDKWLINGPIAYIPPIEVDIVTQQETVSLKENEGIYVQNTRTGEIRSVMGPQSYMIQAEEEMYAKPLSNEMRKILRNGGGLSLSSDADIRKMAYFDQAVGQFDPDRSPYSVITYPCPHNTAVQVYDYQNRKARVVFGPELVVLGPHEDFTILSLSAGKPKKADSLKTICLMLGPDFITDILEVETADHARLSIKLSFNNYFEYTAGDDASEEKIFSVNDFIGFACRQVGGAIRASIAQITFDTFHRNSGRVIHEAVFRDEKRVLFPANNLVISSVDLQSVEPVDAHMRRSLMQSIQMAIEIATKSVERSAEHEAARREQLARGHLERQKLENEKHVEIERARLLQLQAESAGVESTGQAKAEAVANAERMMIEGLSAIELAKLEAQATEILHEADLFCKKSAHAAEIEYSRQMISEEVNKVKQMANIEVTRFAQTVECLGQNTIKAVAVSGEETKVRLLQGLGISCTLITDGNSPINLFNTAEGLIKQ